MQIKKEINNGEEMSQLNNVSVNPKANIYFDGKCISYTVILADDSRCTVGVIFNGVYKFNTDLAELMKLTSGKCRIKLLDTKEWVSYSQGQEFSVPMNSSFDIEVFELLHYVCHYE